MGHKVHNEILTQGSTGIGSQIMMVLLRNKMMLMCNMCVHKLALLFKEVIVNPLHVGKIL